MKSKLSLVMACTIDGGIGYDNKMPWNISNEMKKFKEITTNNENNAVIMGRETWESINMKPLSNRLNIILTRNRICNLNPYNYENVIIVYNINDAVNYCYNNYIDNIFIIGGATIYNIFLQSIYYFKMIDKIYLSIIFYNNNIKTNKFIDIDSIFINFNIVKDEKYKQQCINREFASYICYPKNNFNNSPNMYKYIYRL